MEERKREVWGKKKREGRKEMEGKVRKGGKEKQGTECSYKRYILILCLSFDFERFIFV